MVQTPLIYVALDCRDQEENISLAGRLASSVDSQRYGFKVNLDSIASFSPGALNPFDFVSKISSFGKPVFVDLKMWNGGRTMRKVAEGCAKLGVNIINMYPHSQGKFIREVVRALEGSGTGLFTLTVLTHYTDEDTQQLYGKDLGLVVRMLAQIGSDNGAQGVVLPATQLEVISDFKLTKLCPGIRPGWYVDQKDNFQEQIATPRYALEHGADYLVIGSPIRKALDPVNSLKRIIMEIELA